MSDLHSINDAINKRAGRRLIPSILVGLGLLAIIFSTIALVPILFALFVLIAVLIALHELSTAFRARGINANYAQLSLATTGVLASTWFAGLPGLSISIVVAIISLLFLQLLKGTSGFVTNATGTTFALLYPGFVAGFIFLLARSGDGFAYISTLVILVGLNDTFAYLTGVLIGKHPIAPKISPKKTWEGFIGGTLLTAAVGAYCFYAFFDITNIWQGAIVGALMSVFGTAGDLFESALKREKGIKDSGQFLPGHGGALDRFDAFLFGCILMWALAQIWPMTQATATGIATPF